jgi:hypothetical protein
MPVLKNFILKALLIVVRDVPTTVSLVILLLTVSLLVSMISDLFLESKKEVSLCWGTTIEKYKSVINVPKDTQFVVH